MAPSTPTRQQTSNTTCREVDDDEPNAVEAGGDGVVVGNVAAARSCPGQWERSPVARTSAKNPRTST